MIAADEYPSIIGQSLYECERIVLTVVVESISGEKHVVGVEFCHLIRQFFVVYAESCIMQVGNEDDFQSRESVVLDSVGRRAERGIFPHKVGRKNQYQ